MRCRRKQQKNMIRLSKARLPRTDPRMIARFLFDGSPLSLGFAEAATVEGVVEDEDVVALELVDEEV